MSESAQIVEVLKRHLKSRGLTYRDVALKVGLSEASIKRIFSEETFTLQRLESICQAIGLSINELTRIAADSKESRSQYLTLEQEQLLAGDRRLFACFYLLLNGRDNGDVAASLAVTERELRRLYVKLDAAGLIELLPSLKVRLRIGPTIIWRTDGPVYSAYQHQVKSEFLQSDFQGAHAVLQFRSAELSDASIQILNRKLEALAQEFADLAMLDVRLPRRDKRSVALLLAFRPWVLSMFQALRAAEAWQSTADAAAGQSSARQRTPIE